MSACRDGCRFRGGDLDVMCWMSGDGSRLAAFQAWRTRGFESGGAT